MLSIEQIDNEECVDRDRGKGEFCREGRLNCSLKSEWRFRSNPKSQFRRPRGDGNFETTSEATRRVPVRVTLFDALLKLFWYLYFRQLIARLQNGLRVSKATTQVNLFRDLTVRERLLAMIAGFFAAVALLLAGIGLYAVLNGSVLQRFREIGIRMAIGSSRAGIVRLLALDIFVTITLGARFGVAIGFGAARFTIALFYQVKATDGCLSGWKKELLCRQEGQLSYRTQMLHFPAAASRGLEKSSQFDAKTGT